MITLGIGLALLGVLALWAAGLAAFLVTTCDNRFGLHDAPSLRCLQPPISQLVLCLGGLVAGLAGLVLRRRRTPGAAT